MLWNRYKWFVITVVGLLLILVIVFSFWNVKKEKRYGIYVLDTRTNITELIYTSEKEISFFNLNHGRDEVVFTLKDSDTEDIYTLKLSGSDPVRLTDNYIRDIYPIWSPDDSQIAFLRFKNSILNIYVMDVDGSNIRLLYDCDSHCADLDWENGRVVFTKDSRIWIMDEDGGNASSITFLSNAGVENSSNLPFGDYDPRISPDGAEVIFERLFDDISVHGNYDFFKIGLDGSNEVRLTDTGYAQGVGQWSIDGSSFIYTVASIDDVGVYDLYVLSVDTLVFENITPFYYPENFVCRFPNFLDENKIIFVGEWWE